MFLLIVVLNVPNLVVVVPEDVVRSFRGELDEAGEVDGGTAVDVDVGTSQDGCVRFWEEGK